MRVFLKWLGRAALVVALLCVGIGLWKREEISRLLAVNTLFDADKIVHNFSNMDAAFPHIDLPRGDGPVSPLPAGAALSLPAGYDAWVAARSLTSILVLQDGQVRHEAYFQGTGAGDLRISWSMAKSFLSALFGILVDEGAIASLDAPVTQYVPRLVGSAYDAASIRDVLQMSSGVAFDEDYLDYNSDINKMGRVLALGGKMDDFAAGLTETVTPPGQAWQYTSIDTHIVAMVARAATGQSLSALMTEKLIQPLGLEATPYYLTDGEGVAFALGGLNLTTRDYARFAQMILQEGRWNGRQIVPADWVADSTAPSARTEPGKMGYGYQWWIPVEARAGEVMGRGIYGQYLFLDAQSGVAIVVTAADRNFRNRGVHDMNVKMLREIVAAAEAG